jgi:uncharacterized protein (DUF1697 family)
VARSSAEGWVALLRGINLGSRNRVPMPALRKLCEELGCEDVATYIASGNIVFTEKGSSRAALAGQLEQAIAETFGVTATVVLRSFDEIRKVARSHPFGDDTSHTFVTFLAKKPPQAGVRALASLDIAPDRFEVAGSDVFLHYPNLVQGARLTGALLERHIGVPGTSRNWRTVTRLAEMAEAAA